MDLRQFAINNVIIASAAITVIKKSKQKKEKKNRQYAVSPYLFERHTKGRFAKDFVNLMENPKFFKENFHMTCQNFIRLAEMTELYLANKPRARPDKIPAHMKLAMVLEYMASGTLQRHIASNYRVSKQRFGFIIDEVCDGIIEALRHVIPEWNANNLKKVSEKYETRWNFPNCIGAVDGKHVAIKAPPKSGTIFYNYKGFYSIVLLAVCDADYKFTYFDAGAYGSEGDYNVFKNSSLFDLVSNASSFPTATEINGESVPYFLIADDAFPLGHRVLKPYAGKNLPNQHKIFNYRLSRARRCIEHAFGILANRWLCLKKTLFCGPERAQKILAACVLLHNYLQNGPTDFVAPQTDINNEADNNCSLFSLEPIRGRSGNAGKMLRNHLMHYFNTVGAVPWQWEKI